MRGVGVAVTLAGNAAFLPAIGMGTGAAWGAAGIWAAPRVHIALFIPFSFPFPPLWRRLVQGSLGTVPIPHPELLHKGFRCSPSMAPAAGGTAHGSCPLPAQGMSCCCPLSPGTAAVTALGVPPLEGGISEQWGDTVTSLSLSLSPFPILIFFPVPSWSAARDQAESKAQNPLSSLTV